MGVLHRTVITEHCQEYYLKQQNAKKRIGLSSSQDSTKSSCSTTSCTCSCPSSCCCSPSPSCSCCSSPYSCCSSCPYSTWIDGSDGCNCWWCGCRLCCWSCSGCWGDQSLQWWEL